MLKKIVFSFFFSLTALFIVSVLLAQSAFVSRILTQRLVASLPSHLKVDFSWKDAKVYLFPLKVYLKDPSIVVHEKSSLEIEPGTVLQASILRFSLRWWDIFQGKISFYDVVLQDSTVHLDFKKEFMMHAFVTPKYSKQQNDEAIKHWLISNVIKPLHQFLSINIPLAQDLKLFIQSIVVQNARVALKSPHASFEAFVESLDIKPSFLFSLDEKELLLAGKLRDLRLYYATTSLELSSVALKAKVQKNILNISYLEGTCDDLIAQGSLQVRYNALDHFSLDALEASFSVDASVAALERLMRPFGLFAKLPLDLQHAGGQLKVTADIEQKGALQPITLLANVGLKNPTLGLYMAEFIQGKVLWNSLSRELIVKELNLYESPSVRLPHQLARGGSVHIAEIVIPVDDFFKVSWGIQGRVQWGEVHLHWLLQDVPHIVFPLDFRFSGDTQFSFDWTKEAGWKLLTNVNLVIPEFLLDPSKWTKPELASKGIFQAESLAVNGSLVWTAKGVALNSLNLVLPHSHLVTTGFVDFKKGLTLDTRGHVLLQDFRQIGAQQLEGDVHARIQSTGKFHEALITAKLDIKKLHAFNMHLGSGSGLLTYSFQTDRLQFSHMSMRHGVTDYNAHGELNFGGGGEPTVNVQASFLKGRFEDILSITKYLHQSLPWFPASLQGDVQGVVKLSGIADISLLRIATHLVGSKVLIANESFSHAEFRLGYDAGRYYAEQIQFKKKQATLEATVSYIPQKHLGWTFTVQKLNFLHFDYFKRLKWLLQGEINAHSLGSEHYGVLDGNLMVDVKGMQIFQRKYGDLLIQASAKNNKVTVVTEGVYDTLWARLGLHLRSLEESEFQCELNKFPIELLWFFISPELAKMHAFSNRISAKAALFFKGLDIAKASGDIDILEYVLKKEQNFLELSSPVSLHLEKGDFHLKSLKLQSHRSFVELVLLNAKDRLQGNILGDVDSFLLELLQPDIEQTQGTIKVNMKLQGSLQSPELTGHLIPQDVLLKLQSLETRIRGVTGLVQVHNNVLVFEDLRGSLGSGWVSVYGDFKIFGYKPSVLHVTLRLKNAQMRVPPFANGVFNGEFNVTGSQEPYMVKGSVSIDKALYVEKFLQRGSKKEIKVAQYAPPALVESWAKTTSAFNLDVRLDFLDQVFIENDLVSQANLTGSLLLTNTIDRPILLGKLNVHSGTCSIKGRKFTIRSGTVLLDSPVQIKPIISVNTFTEVAGYNIEAYAHGEGADLQFDFSSNPPLSPAEIVSLLAIGYTTQQLAKLNAQDISTIQQNEVAALAYHSLGADLKQAIEDSTGFELDLDRSFNVWQGVSAFRPQTQADSLVASQLTLKRSLGRNWSFIFGSTIANSTNRALLINIKYMINPSLSFNAMYTDLSSSNAALPGTSPESSQNALGLDLKFQLRLK